MGKKNDELTLELAAPDEVSGISLEAFAKVISSVRSMLKSLDANHTAAWRVERLSMNSPATVEIAGWAVNGGVDRKVVDNFLGVFEALSTNGRLPNVSQSVVRKARVLMNVLNDDLGRMRFTSPGRRSVVPARKPREETLAIQKAAEISDYYDAVELVGNLRIVSNAGDRLIFYVIDPLSKHPTECVVSERDFVRALEAMKLSPSHSPRVAVFGKTLYRNDKPERMKVEQFSVIPGIDGPSVLFAVQGINITDGVDSVVYVRSLRDV